ncbi:matrixin family metalloprotease, partial [bacterium]|nr:matrixin family metalloprotease [bacterium]
MAGMVSQTLPVPDDFIFGKKWGSPTLGTPATVTWSFQPTTASQTALGDFMPNGYADEVRQAFQTWSSVANITFVEVASGGQIKLLGKPIDGSGGTAGTGQYPGSGSSTITFDTGNAWSLTQGTGGSYIYQTALHEIGHSIGLLHPPHVIAAMNHVISSAFEGLLPTDVAGIQAIYGPSASVNNAQYLPTNITQLTIDPTSQVNVTLSIPGFLTVTQSTTISGTIDARLDGLSTGSPTALTFYDGNLSLADLSVNLQNAVLTGSANFHNLVADLFSKDWFGPAGHLTPIVNGQFSVASSVLGIDGGTADYAISVPIAGLNTSGTLNFGEGENTGPVSFATTDTTLLGSIERVGSNLNLSIPVFVHSSITVPAGSGSIPLDITVSGSIKTSVAVPEMSSLFFVGCTLSIGIGIMGRRVYHRPTA